MFSNTIWGHLIFLTWNKISVTLPNTLVNTFIGYLFDLKYQKNIQMIMISEKIRGVPMLC